MIKQSLGLIETVGLSAAIEAADTAVKSANVTLVGYEQTKGGGMVVVKLLGEVGAVNAAIDAARISASKVSQVYATKVIARIGEGLDVIIKPQDNLKPEITSTNNEAVIESIEKTSVDASINASIDSQFIAVKVLPEGDETVNDQGCMFNQDITVETPPATTKPDQTSKSTATSKIVKGNTSTKKRK